MEFLFDDERPRCRPACLMAASVFGCQCSDSVGGSLIEIELPNSALRLGEDFVFGLEGSFLRAMRWHYSTLVEEGRTRCPIDLVQEYVPQLKDLPDWSHAEDLEFRLFPERYPSNTTAGIRLSLIRDENRFASDLLRR